MRQAFSETPLIIRDSEGWAVGYKPHGMPTAPLHEGEGGTFLTWFLEQYPLAGAVTGRKGIEKGLLHRLDTPTEGLVLVAKNQKAYEVLLEYQERDLLEKSYLALCLMLTEDLPETPRAIESRFRPYGPGSREVRPLFPGDRRFAAAGRDYRTMLEACILREGGFAECRCRLTRGYRHQVRSHLASLGLPIAGDSLYAPPSSFSGPLMLCASALRFQDPDSGSITEVSLP